MCPTSFGTLFFSPVDYKFSFASFFLLIFVCSVFSSRFLCSFSVVCFVVCVLIQLLLFSLVLFGFLANMCTMTETEGTVTNPHRLRCSHFGRKMISVEFH